MVYSEINVDDLITIEYKITEEMIDAFAELSGDYSPIHMDKATAEKRGFQDRIAHGLLVGSLVSQILGMSLPGPNGLLHEVNFKYKKPVYPGDKLTFIVKVKEKHDTFQLVVLAVTVKNSENETVCRGTVHSSLAR